LSKKNCTEYTLENQVYERSGIENCSIKYIFQVCLDRWLLFTRCKPSRNKPSKMTFVGREKEKMQLSELINSSELSTGLIYGRRRVGKSELVKHVLKEHESKSFHFECKQVSQENNSSSLADMIADKLHRINLFNKKMWKRRLLR
jgi:hypothetical protein